MNKGTWQNATDSLKRGGVVVFPTDTIYGILGSALDPNVVNKIYLLRERGPEKPMIILISSIKELEKFHVGLSPKQKKLLKAIWPNPVSVVLPCYQNSFKYLHRGTNSLAFRIPNYPKLLGLLKQTGPLVAPSANPEGKPPAKNIKEAYEYFADQVDVYVASKSKAKNPPSTIIRLDKGKVTPIRKGAFLMTSKVFGS